MAQRGRKKVTPEMIEKMEKLRGDGLSYERIASKLGVAPMTVYNYLKKERKAGFVERLKQRLGFG